VRRTTKLIEGGHRGLQDYRHICRPMLLLLRFLRLYVFFFKIQKVVAFYVFCHVSYVFHTMIAVGGVTGERYILNVQLLLMSSTLSGLSEITRYLLANSQALMSINSNMSRSSFDISFLLQRHSIEVTCLVCQHFYHVWTYYVCVNVLCAQLYLTTVYT